MLSFKIMLRFVAVSGVSAALMIRDASFPDTLTERAEPGLEKRCTWDDGVGPVGW